MGFEPGTRESIRIPTSDFGMSARPSPEIIMKTETEFPRFPDFWSNDLGMVAKFYF